MVDLQARILDDEPIAAFFDESTIAGAVEDVSQASLEAMIRAIVNEQLLSRTKIIWKTIFVSEPLTVFTGYEITGLSRLDLILPSAENGDVVTFFDNGSGFNVSSTNRISVAGVITSVNGDVRSRMKGTGLICKRTSELWIGEVVSGYVEVV